jgi:hypothetical protein
MSPEAIDLRLRRVSQLRDLCLSLGKATIIRDGEARPAREVTSVEPPGDEYVKP